MENEELFDSDKRLIRTTNAEKRETMRGQIAILYVSAFFAIILFGLVTAYVKDFNTDEYSDILLTISGILSGPLGFIIGFYFKNKDS